MNCFETYPEWLVQEIQELEAKLPNAPRGSKEAVLAIAGLWAGEPEELEHLLAEVMQARNSDIPPEANEKL